MSGDVETPYTESDIKLIPLIANNTKILRVMLVNSSYSREQIIDAVPGLQMAIEMKHRTMAHVHWETKQAWSYIDFHVNSKANSGPHKDKPCFQVNVRLEVRYLYDGTGVKQEDVERALNALCHTSALSHGWSFIRQHIHDAMSRMLLPPIELPLYTGPIWGQPKIEQRKRSSTASKVKHTK